MAKPLWFTRGRFVIITLLTLLFLVILPGMAVGARNEDSADQTALLNYDATLEHDSVAEVIRRSAFYTPEQQRQFRATVGVRAKQLRNDYRHQLMSSRLLLLRSSVTLGGAAVAVLVAWIILAWVYFSPKTARVVP